MPQINMATIEKLRMRLHQLKQADEAALDEVPNVQQNQWLQSSIEVTPRQSADAALHKRPIARQSNN